MSLSDSVREERAKRKEQAFARREQDILDVAEQLMMNAGIRQVSVDVIAARAGIGKGTIYKHFDSKRAILMRIVLRHFDRLQQVLGQSTDPIQATADWMEAQLYGASKVMLVQALIVEMASEADAVMAMRDGQERMQRRLAQVLSRKVSDAEALMQARWLTAIVQGGVSALSDPLKRDDFDRDALIDQLVQSVRHLTQSTGSKSRPVTPEMTYL